MRIKLDESAYSSSFKPVLYSWDRYLGAYGGRGSTKTDTFYLKWLVSLFEPFHFKLAYINQELSNIRDQQYAGFKRVAKRIGLYDHLRFYDGDYRITNPKSPTDNMLVPKGMDDPEKTKGMDDLTAIWWDEINKGTVEGFRFLNELLRTPNAEYLQFAFSFNPVSETHWLRKTFFHPEDRHKVHPDFEGQLYLHRSTYKDNEFIDQEAYLQTLLLSAAGNKNAIRVNIEGDWGLEENNAPWLHAFDEDKHVRDVRFIPEYPVHLSFDFNNSPFACTAWQHNPSLGNGNSFIHGIKEFTGELKVDEMCAQIKAYFPNSILYVTGDRSGQNEDVGRNNTIYELIATYLKISPKQLHLNTHNLEHADSRLFINAMLYNYPNIYLSKSGMPNLIQQCHQATLDLRDRAKPQQLLKDRQGHKNDEFDSMRYYFQTYFHKFAIEKFGKGW